MNRLIIIAALLLACLLTTQYVLNNRRESQRKLTSSLRQLPDNSGHKTSSIRQLRLAFGDTIYQYAFTDTWRYPAYHNAFVHADLMKRFIEGVLESDGTIVETDRFRASYYGIDTPNMLVVTLTDSASWTQTVQIGRSLPRAAQEAYMAVANNDTLFHIHADPRPLLYEQRDPNRAPLIDPKIMPTALTRRSIVHITFQKPGYSIRSLERIEIKQKEDNRRPQDGPTYEWFATPGNRKINNTSVYAYISFLTRLKYTDLLSEQKSGEGYVTSLVILTDDNGIADTLDVGGTTSGGLISVRHRTTDQVFALSPQKAGMIFPPMSLFDTLPDPSPFNLAEPINPFGTIAP